MGDNVHGTFICEKPYRIRWKPEEFFESQSFLTGSWDNQVNFVKLWTYTINEDDPDIYPFVLESLPFIGDVTEILFFKQETAVVSSSAGYIKLLNVKNDQNGTSDLSEITTWDKLHYFNDQEASPCTAMSVYDDDIVTVGEDGRINLLTAKEKRPVHTIHNADSCSLHCVTFLKHNEALTGNLRGQMKIWDLRSTGDQPMSTFMLSGEQIGASCLTIHPTQHHIVLAGGEDGSLTIWDLRQNTYPVTLLNAHSDTVSEIKFHPHHPEKLFSCSISGELWHWKSNVQRASNKLLNLEDNEECLWLNSDAVKNRLEVFSLMPKLHKPINSLDISRDKVLCGCDNEALYVINNIDLIKN